MSGNALFLSFRSSMKHSSQQLGIYCGTLSMTELRFSQRGEWRLKSTYTLHQFVSTASDA